MWVAVLGHALAPDLPLSDTITLVVVTAAALLARCRTRVGLSKRELARRAGTSPAAIVWTESGARDPSVGTLARCIEAAGFRIELDAWLAPDAEVNGRRLVEVLDLADALPRRPAARTLAMPKLPMSPVPGVPR